MNKFFVGLLVVIAGAIFGWYTFKGNELQTISDSVVSRPTPVVSEVATPIEKDTSAVATSTITYTDKGFSPAQITVKRGTTVAFVNKSAGNMWVASDVHPTHQLLPGFDELKAETNGAVYTYTFVTTGSWTFHNHVSPTNIGVVVVTQ